MKLPVKPGFGGEGPFFLMKTHGTVLPTDLVAGLF
jgi:hypothetical protein